MAAVHHHVKTDGKPMTVEEITLSVPQTSRQSSEIECDVSTPTGTKHTYTERKWPNLDQFEYRYDKTDPGYVMIINQMNFKEGDPRIGTDFDVEEIVKCFGRQGYNIGHKNIVNDATREELLNEVDRVCKNELGDTNSLIVFVLSHGEMNNRFNAFDESVGMQEVVEPFLKVESLINKPKIFIFQTCKTTANQRDAKLEQIEKEKKKKKKENKDEDVNDFKLYVNTVLTAQPDVLLFCSTLEGDYAYRDFKRGTWLIQELCRNIYTYGHREEILSILIRCNKCMGRNYYYAGDSSWNEKQTPLFVSTLTKNFYVCRSKDRYFFIEKMNQLREAQKQTDMLLRTMTIRRRTIYDVNEAVKML